MLTGCGVHLASWAIRWSDRAAVLASIDTAELLSEQ
jgi:hypothetical protein